VVRSQDPKLGLRRDPGAAEDPVPKIDDCRLRADRGPEAAMELRPRGTKRCERLSCAT
jgi:hypothetical protein